ncbi:MAG: ABC transporter permease subunit [Phycisphaeraceae bacterium]|nr:ABC transporter permease subunit [Phycisphaeraceae bacterium]
MSFSGRTRDRKTRTSVKVIDVLARSVITVGGIGTVLAVTGVFVFLLFIAIPLFKDSSSVETGRIALPWGDQTPDHLVIDDFRLMAWAGFADGRLVLISLENGQILDEFDLFESGDRPTAAAFSDANNGAAFGFADGSIQVANIDFEVEFLNPREVPRAYRDMAVNESRIRDSGVIERTPSGLFRVQRLAVNLEDRVESPSPSAVRRMDYTITSSGPIFGVLTEDGQLKIERISRRENWMTGEVTVTLEEGILPLEIGDRGEPDFVLVPGLGDNVMVAWKDGHLKRFDTRRFNNPILAEELNLLDHAPGAEITSIRFLLGRETIMVGDSQGHVRAWFRVKPTLFRDRTSDGRPLTMLSKVPPIVAHRLVEPDPWTLPLGYETVADQLRTLPTPDETLLVAAHDLPRGPGAVTSMNISQRTRMLGVGFANGDVRVYYVTNQARIKTSSIERDVPVQALAISPRDDGFLAIGGGLATRWDFDPGHPEINLRALFAPIWYEGLDQPDFVWQSVGATDEFEPKMSFVPLVFGTIKATIYSVLFAFPLAILAAIFTSEFLHPRTKAKIKPVIELMASLPSVVLGYIAGLVLAERVEHMVPAVICLFVTIPLMFLVGAYLWQLLPRSVVIHLDQVGHHPAMGGPMARALGQLSRLVRAIGGVKLILLSGLAILGIALAYQVGPRVEIWLFGADIRQWLRGTTQFPAEGNPAGGWFFLLLPMCALIVALSFNRLISPWFRSASSTWSRPKAGSVDLLKFAFGLVLTFVLALVVSQAMASMGFDLRGDSFFPPDLVNTYAQRNALVVGFIMGFAVIPIIYTISEDALSAVPEHLRSASLGAGATPWQTAIRIIVPTAASGLFSACMIGLGRAVGETMIVLMAAGNTPVLEWNIFSGFRTLSANIAEEMPEAVRNSTHYRVLFLAALTLFAMTFVINTIAEAVRLRFRKKAFKL